MGRCARGATRSRGGGRGAHQSQVCPLKMHFAMSALIFELFTKFTNSERATVFSFGRSRKPSSRRTHSASSAQCE